MILCPKDDCECHRPDCQEHGCMDDGETGMIVCETCGGSGFSGRGTGYDDVCGQCGGLKYFPK